MIGHIAGGIQSSPGKVAWLLPFAGIGKGFDDVPGDATDERRKVLTNKNPEA